MNECGFPQRRVALSRKENTFVQAHTPGLAGVDEARSLWPGRSVGESTAALSCRKPSVKLYLTLLNAVLAGPLGSVFHRVFRGQLFLRPESRPLLAITGP